MAQKQPLNKYCALKNNSSLVLAIIYARDIEEAVTISNKWFNGFPFTVKIKAYQSLKRAKQ
jgi:hypothetical protein